MGIDKFKYKDELPLKTVEKIKLILDDIGVNVVEDWADESIVKTDSLRLNVEGTQIGSNGKGMSKEYARASAYAEFIERYQNVKLQGNSILCNVLRNNDFEFQLFPDEKLLSAEELIDEDNDFINMFLEKRGFTHCYDKEKAVEELKKYQKMDYNIFLKKNSFLSIPYYSVKKNKVTYVPFFSANLHYGSNGMCAGNTGEEALVQGISEIIERIVQTKIVMDQVKLPDVPEEYLKRYPSIYEMYKIVKSLDDYSIFLKDCSFGGKYSAVALIIVEKKYRKVWR